MSEGVFQDSPGFAFTASAGWARNSNGITTRPDGWSFINAYFAAFDTISRVNLEDPASPIIDGTSPTDGKAVFCSFFFPLVLQPDGTYKTILRYSNPAVPPWTIDPGTGLTNPSQQDGIVSLDPSWAIATPDQLATWFPQWFPVDGVDGGFSIDSNVLRGAVLYAKFSDKPKLTIRYVQSFPAGIYALFGELNPFGNFISYFSMDVYDDVPSHPPISVIAGQGEFDAGPSAFPLTLGLLEPRQTLFAQLIGVDGTVADVIPNTGSPAVASNIWDTRKMLGSSTAFYPQIVLTAPDPNPLIALYGPQVSPPNDNPPAGGVSKITNVKYLYSFLNNYAWDPQFTGGISQEPPQPFTPLPPS